MRRDQQGFTLIELLIVILIIGILAAIAIPAFLGQRARAQDTAAKTMVRHAQAAIESHYQAGNTYTGATVALLQAIEPSLAPGKGPTLAAPTTLSLEGYVLSVTSKSTNIFRITKVPTIGVTQGLTTRTCTRLNTKGGCRASLTW
jgi:type IV pilus assembly protein PilA